MNEVLQRIEALFEKEKVTVADFCRDTGLKHSTYSSWKKYDRVPKHEPLTIIAEYFDVSVDYLLNGTNEKPIDVGVEIQRLINHLTGDNSSYCNGKIMSKEGELALLNSLKQDVEFLNALYKNDNK